MYTKKFFYDVFLVAIFSKETLHPDCSNSFFVFFMFTLLKNGISKSSSELLMIAKTISYSEAFGFSEGFENLYSGSSISSIFYLISFEIPHQIKTAYLKPILEKIDDSKPMKLRNASHE